MAECDRLPQDPRAGDWPEPIVCDQAEDFAGMVSRAAFNEARTHRYLLARSWQPELPVMTWVMLNPSTADAFADDPTIRRCAGFARREGCGGIKVVNLFALRATDPRELRLHGDPVGACNDQVIDAHACGTVVVAWGAGGGYAGRSDAVTSILLAAGVAPVCLGVTAGGQPRHPLYVRGDAPLVPWQPVPDPRDSPAGPVPVRGPDALDAPLDPGGIEGHPELPAGACHPLASAGTAPGRPVSPGAESAQEGPFPRGPGARVPVAAEGPHPSPRPGRPTTPAPGARPGVPVAGSNAAGGTRPRMRPSTSPSAVPLPGSEPCLGSPPAPGACAASGRRQATRRPSTRRRNVIPLPNIPRRPR